MTEKIVKINFKTLLYKTVLSVFVVLLFFPSLTRAGEDLKVLSLEDAIKRAIKNSPSVLYQNFMLEASKKQKRSIWGTHLPQINILSEAKRTKDPEAISPASGPGKFSPFSRDIYSLDVMIDIPIYEGGRISKKVEIANLDTKIRESLKKQTINDLIANIEDSFYLGLYLRSLIKAQKAAIDALNKEYDDAKLRLKIGKIAPLDLLRIKTQLVTEEAELKKSKEYLKRTKQAISVLMGETPNDNFILSGVLLEKPFVPTIEYSKIESLILLRPDIRTAQKEVKKVLEKLSLAKRNHLPSVHIFSSYGKRAGSGFNNDRDLWQIGANLKFNVYSGGSISAEIERTRLELFALKQKLQQKILNGKREVMAAISKLKETSVLIKRYKLARDTAKETYRVERLKYRTGAGTLTDLLLSQSNWLIGEANYLKAVYLHKKAKIEYEYALGRIAHRWIGKD